MTVARSRMVWLPWTVFLLATVMAAADVIVSVQNDQALHRHARFAEWLIRVATGLEPVTFSAVGAFIVTRRPGNRIGWLMIAGGFTAALSNFMSDYPSLGRHSSRPLLALASWVGTWDWTLGFASLLLLILLFPTGELLSRRWRPVPWLGLVSLGAIALLQAVRAGPMGEAKAASSNPIGFVAVPDFVIGLLGLGFVLSLPLALLSLVLRFRSARVLERQQLEWFTYGAVLAITGTVGAGLTGWSYDPLVILAQTATAALPIFMGIAILRYRLYDIDVLINRTIVYALLSISLAIIYLVGVIGLQAIFRAVTGQASDAAIAISTLAIAALFQPLRRRIQSTIDQRFYRRKYDAVRTLATFSAKLRDEVDLEQLTSELLGVLDETVRPAHASLWLRPSGAAGIGQKDGV